MTGIQIKITKDGLEILQDKVNILDITGKEDYGMFGEVSYGLTSMDIKNVSIPTFSAIPTDGGFQIKVGGGVIAIYGDWNVAYSKFGIEVTDNGTFDIKGSGLDIGADLQFGKPAPPCTVSIKTLDVTFHGGTVGWIVDLFDSFIDKKLNEVATEKIRELVDKEIQDHVETS